MLSRQIHLIDQLTVQPRDRGQLVFHHIPKTAGSSFTQLLRTLYLPEQISSAATDFELMELERNGLIGNYQLYTGHYSFDMMMNHFGSATRLTFLRDPIERCISQYYNWHDSKRISKSWLERGDSVSGVTEAIQLAQSMTLDEFVSSDNEFISDSAQNMLTRYLASRCDWIVEQDYYDKELVESAKSNLELKFDFFGITELFEQSKLLLAAVLGIRPWKSTEALMTNFNPTKASAYGKYVVTASQRQKLESYNRMDIELFKFARQLFEYRLNKLSTVALDKLYELQIQQSAYVSSAPLNWVEVNVGEGFCVRGFHYTEQAVSIDGETREYRWTGLSDEASIEFSLPVSQCERITVEINVIEVAAPSCLKNLELTLNSITPVRQVQFQSNYCNVIKADFVIPQQKKYWAIQTLTIRSPLEQEPGSLPDQSRKLGLAIESIKAYAS